MGALGFRVLGNAGVRSEYTQAMVSNMIQS